MILAIDPGNIQSAYVLYDGEKIIEADKVDNEMMRILIECRNADISTILIEMVASYGMPVGKEVFDTVLWIGRFIELAENRAIDHELIYRRQVKIHHCNSMKAKDSNIIQALKDKYGDKGTKANPGFFYGFKEDLWQAFAIAAYYQESRK